MKRLLFIFIGIVFFFKFTTPALAQESYQTGTVQETSENTYTDESGTFYSQKVTVLRDVDQKTVTIQLGSEVQPINEQQLLKEGRSIILGEMESGESVFVDVNRLPTIIILSLLFTLAVVAVARLQGVRSILGMMLSFGVLVNFILPQILAGQNPILISLVGALIIGAATVYLSHGWTIQSHLALTTMMMSLALVSLISWLAVRSAQLVGLGSEEAYYLQFGTTSMINLQGLLLGGIILGALGVLDDITIAQISTVFQLKAAAKNIGFAELFQRGLQVGRDHVASLVNTLVLAYAGANLPLFLLFMSSHQVPAWVTLSSEIIVEEIIRTLAGSIGLIAAVPLATLFATWAIFKYNISPDTSHKGHTHG